MRTYERLRKMQGWFEGELCAGRMLKAPIPTSGPTYGPDITNFTRTEPRVFIAYQPMRPNEPGRVDPRDPYSVCPAITIMPVISPVRYVPEKRFDRYQKVHRPQQMGQSLTVQILFSVYEPGVRLPGFVEALKENRQDAMALFEDGTEAGVQTLFDWMDDCKELLLRERTVPGTDLVLEDDNLTYSLYSDQEYVVDKRPLYYGFINAEFKCYADAGNDHGKASRTARLLEDGL